MDVDDIIKTPRSISQDDTRMGILSHHIMNREGPN
jgi:hypothetical protein